MKNNSSQEKVVKTVKKYRLAKLSSLKAKLHWAEEMDFLKKPHEVNFENLRMNIINWTNKSIGMIIQELEKSSVTN